MSGKLAALLLVPALAALLRYGDWKLAAECCAVAGGLWCAWRIIRFAWSDPPDEIPALSREHAEPQPSGRPGPVLAQAPAAAAPPAAPPPVFAAAESEAWADVRTVVPLQPAVSTVAEQAASADVRATPPLPPIVFTTGVERAALAVSHAVAQAVPAKQPVKRVAPVRPPKARKAKPAAVVRPRLMLHYVDADGVITERMVDLAGIEALSPTGPVTHIRGFCHLRLARRTFLRDRVQAAFDPATGARIGDLDSYLLSMAQPDAA